MLSSRRHAFKLTAAGLSAAPAALFQSLPQAAHMPSTSVESLIRPDALIMPGARQPNEASDTKRLQRALDEARKRGGGTVFIPAGHYVSGTLLLRASVSIWLDNGAVLAMSPDNAEFLPPEKLAFDAGANLATSDFHFALLAGEDIDQIAIFGEGVIECDRGTKGGGPKPIALRRCNYVSLRGITLRNAQNYNISLLGCDFVDIDGVTILAGHADGIDPDCCRHLRIANCYIESADDSLCLKASGALGRRGVTEFVAVTNCVLRTASIHFKCGTESCGDFRNITVVGCTFEGGAGMRHGNPGLAFYTVDEGALENIAVSDITMRDVGTPIAIIRGDRDRCAQAKGPGVLRSIRISDVIATGARLPSVIAGMPGYPVEEIHLCNISIAATLGHTTHTTLSGIPEAPKAYPQPTMFGELPASGLFLRHVVGISLRNTVFSLPPEDPRPEIVADDAAGLRLELDRSTTRAGAQLWLNDVRESFIHAVALTPLLPGAYRVTGSKSANLYLRGDGTIDWQQHLTIAPEVPGNAIHSHDSTQRLAG